MVEKEIRLHEGRVEVFVKRIRKLFYEKEIPINAEYCKFKPIVPFEERKDGKYKPINKGDSWGKNWDMAWFYLTGEIPKEWKGNSVTARINLGGEALSFSKNGTPETALSCHTIWPDPDFGRDRITITDKAK